MEDKEGT